MVMMIESDGGAGYENDVDDVNGCYTRDFVL